MATINSRLCVHLSISLSLSVVALLFTIISTCWAFGRNDRKVGRLRPAAWTEELFDWWTVSSNQELLQTTGL
jgi:hypothetical protein